MRWSFQGPYQPYPFIDTTHYSALALALNGLGCLIWVAAYAGLIRSIRVRHFVEMPAFVAGANIAWELVWSVVYRPATGKIFWFMYIAAFVLDLYIFRAMWLYGDKQCKTERGKALFRPLIIVNALAWLGFLIWWEGRPALHDPIGANTGYLINLVLSASCLVMYLRVGRPDLFSRGIALARTLGTGFISVSLLWIYPGAHLLLATALACLLIDTGYTALSFKRQSPWW